MAKRKKQRHQKRQQENESVAKRAPQAAADQFVDDTTSGDKTSGDKSESIGVHGFIPGLDGMRGIAILLVVIYHSNLMPQQQTEAERLWFSVVGMGWSGVDVFFVLSGFLITGILVDAKERAGEGGDRGGIWKRFFARRVLRIFPLYYVFLAAHQWALPALGRALKDPVLQQPIQDPLWFWLYLPNVFFAAEGNFVGPRPLHAMWSLGIEEQFYLVWPLLVLLVARRHLPLLCVGGIAAALLSRVYLGATDAPWVQAFVLPHCRMDTLLFGALVALWLRSATAPSREKVNQWAPLALAVTSAAIVLTIVVTGALRQYSPPIFTVGFSVLAVWATAMLLVCLAAPQGSLRDRFFTFAPLRFVGRYAYGLYLTHTIVQHFVLQWLDPQALYASLGQSRLAVQLVFTAVSTPIAIAVAVAVFHVFENHFLKLKRFVPMAARSSDSAPGAAAP